MHNYIGFGRTKYMPTLIIIKVPTFMKSVIISIYYLYYIAPDLHENLINPYIT
jgi:hypothetical protein